MQRKSSLTSSFHLFPTASKPGTVEIDWIRLYGENTTDAMPAEEWTFDNK